MKLLLILVAVTSLISCASDEPKPTICLLRTSVNTITCRNLKEKKTYNGKLTDLKDIDAWMAVSGDDFVEGRNHYIELKAERDRLKRQLGECRAGK